MKILDEIKQELANGFTGKAVGKLMNLIEKDYFTSFNQEIILISNNYKEIHRDKIKGIISDSDQRLEQNKIVDRLLSLLTEIEKNLIPTNNKSEKTKFETKNNETEYYSPKCCLLYTSPSPRDQRGSRMPSSA